jgi:group I intron endonuclease
MYGYIYKFTLIPTGKIYVGKRKATSFDTKYYGSGKKWKPLVEQYGKDNVNREILEWCETEELLNSREKYWIEQLNSRDPHIGYNISKGGHNPILEGVANAMYGRTHTEEVRKRISEHHTGIKRDETFKKRRSQFMSNKHWYNNGIVDKYFLDTEVPDGFVKGRIKSKPKTKTLTPQDIIKQQVKDVLGEETYKSMKKFVVNNGEYELMLPICPEGFSLGRLPEHSAKVGLSNRGKTVSEQTKKKISEKMSGEGNPMFGVHRYGKSAPTYGKIMSEHTKRLISDKNKGRIWVTNGVDSKVIHKEELESYIQLGFKKGRKKS